MNASQEVSASRKHRRIDAAGGAAAAANTWPAFQSRADGRRLILRQLPTLAHDAVTCDMGGGVGVYERHDNCGTGRGGQWAVQARLCWSATDKCQDQTASCLPSSCLHSPTPP